MKKTVITFVLIIAAFSPVFSYDYAAAGISAAGGAAGSYIGQSLAVPVLVLASDTGLTGGDIFSPFSTAIYRAMEIGAVLGTIAGEIASKYIYYAVLKKNINWNSFGIDVFIDSYIVIISHLILNEIGDDMGVSPFIRNIIVVPSFGGIYLGWLVPDAG
ncbi:MAG: hypothetical protein GXP33_02555 [Spirochaetes bacterium]|nr:hypothetical protein [Spirochaetota bacterium]